MEQQKEMNLWDLCISFGHAIGRGCNALLRIFVHMVRLSYRKWWIVLCVIIPAIVAALYLTRTENLTYRVNAVAMLNGASISQFEQAYAPLQSKQDLPKNASITPIIEEDKAFDFKTFRVIDCKHDGYADYVDFKEKSTPMDTSNVQMQDRLCLQFSIKKRNMDLLPKIENALLEWLNANQAMQQSFVGYMNNMRSEVEFNHTQAVKLDSLTSNYYFSSVSGQRYGASVGSGVNFYGDRHINLFLDDIYKQREHMQKVDYRMQFATAPVTLENHFAVARNPVNGRIKHLLIFFFFGWIAGCVLAEFVEKRKDIIAWLSR